MKYACKNCKKVVSSKKKGIQQGSDFYCNEDCLNDNSKVIALVVGGTVLFVILFWFWLMTLPFS